MSFRTIENGLKRYRVYWFGIAGLLVFGFTAYAWYPESVDRDYQEWSYRSQSAWLKEHSQCGRYEQSPIDLSPHIYRPHSELFHLHGYDKLFGQFNIENNGFTIMVTKAFKIDAQIGVERIASSQFYHFDQLHFHWGANDSVGSEHSIGSQFYPVEFHFVHKSATGKLLVVALFAQVVCEPSSTGLNDLLVIIKKLQLKKAMSARLNLSHLLPSKLSDYFSYTGSLTTPPCTEGVQWIVLANPITISENFTSALRQTMNMNGQRLEFNYRELKLLGNRKLFFSGKQIPSWMPSETTCS